MYRILIFSDSKYRDLPSNILLKHKLQQELPESSILISPFNIWDKVVKSFNPHLVVLNHILGKRNRSIASYVKRHGGKVAVLFTEGIIEFSGKKEVFSAQKDNDYVDVCILMPQQCSGNSSRLSIEFKRKRYTSTGG